MNQACSISIGVRYDGEEMRVFVSFKWETNSSRGDHRRLEALQGAQVENSWQEFSEK
jgi:hypothetical protein